MSRIVKKILLLLLIVASAAVMGRAYAQTVKTDLGAHSMNPDMSIRVLEKRLAQIEERRKELDRNRRKQMTLLEDLAGQIEKLKGDPSRSIFSEARLQRLLARHLELSREVERIDGDLKQGDDGKKRIVEQLAELYEGKIARAVESMTGETDRQKSLDLVREYFQLREKADQYRSRTLSGTDAAAFSIKLLPLDGPREIQEKIDLLKDRIRKLSDIVRRIDKEIQRLKNEKSLAREMRQLMDEKDLFEEGALFAPSPRALPVRREPGAQPAEPGAPSEKTGFDSAGVHTSPVATEAEEDRGSQAGSIDKEILRLETEKRFLLLVIEELKRKVEEFARTAKKLSVSGPPEGRPKE